MSAREPAFGERFARNWAAGMAGLGLFTAIAVVVGPGRLFPFAAVVPVLALSWGFRRRALYDEARPRRILEDERDHAFLARGDRGFRLAASAWMVGVAVALAIAPLRELLLAQPLRLSGVLVLGVIAANVVAHLVVAVSYRRDHP
ncbi:hypothetical protein [Pseudoxanthomonas suwonensis]|uniref:Transmembrane protein n=1 Tax=Pseudoxanthomonas suwonensis TaxID=314722 RepID=A0A0E3UMD4_9GAMM|nr:hypothetical protein [Pseudoxanthomonas suwonensis]AKC85940.1 hypothetical protein WQ53_03345 [Pseudoxanthomonas suwonensis]